MEAVDSERETLLPSNANGNEAAKVKEDEHDKHPSRPESARGDEKRPPRLDIPDKIPSSPSTVSFRHQESVGSFSTYVEKDANKSTMPAYARGKRVSTVETMIATSKTWKQHGK